mmetsp:Transcript_7884/g.10196  ORF Transcript_7884/g.10196 Transcript_7884/m.10196 type:complete len:211 (-) Transcript_7884:196-828(-)
MFKRVLHIPQNHPFIFGVSTATIKTGGVDYLVQKHVEKKDEIEWRRVAVFTTFGFLYTGSWQYLLFVKIMPKYCPNSAAFIAKPFREKLRDKQGLKEVLVQNFMENGLNNPFLYFPIFYTIQEFLNKGKEGKVMNALNRYRENCIDDLFAIWSLWIPAQAFNFGFSPLWLRVPFVAFVSTIWTGYMSFTRGAFNASSLTDDSNLNVEKHP